MARVYGTLGYLAASHITNGMTQETIGSSACSFYGWYWNFIDQQSHPRTSLTLANWNKRNSEDKNVILEQEMKSQGSSIQQPLEMQPKCGNGRTDTGDHAR